MPGVGSHGDCKTRNLNTPTAPRGRRQDWPEPECVETVSADRLRDLLGVPPGQYERVDNLMRKVVEPAVLQVNGLSDMGVMVEPRRKHARAPVDRFDVAWWRKSPEETVAVAQERNRSKVGRMARLKGAVETSTPRVALLA